MKKPKVEKRQTLTEDWNKEIQSYFTDVIKHQLVDSNLLNQGVSKKPKETFCIGSTYEGQRDCLGFAGNGTYVYPHGAKYQGDFWNGQFHGNGTITYPSGQELIATWQNGKMVEHSYKFPDGLMYEKKFDYCQLPDRRFQKEKKTELNSPEKEMMTNEPTKPMPKNCYDTVDGYYDPKSKIVYAYDRRVMRVVTTEEEKQIIDQFRQENDKPTSSVKGMYRYWTSGRKKEIEELVQLVQKERVKTEEISMESSTLKSPSIHSI